MCAGSGAGGGTPFNTDGVFYVNSATTYADIIDGTSQTIAASESLLGYDTQRDATGAATGVTADRTYRFVLGFTSTPDLTDAKCSATQLFNSTAGNGNDPRGFAWCSGEYRCALYNHYYAPNSPTCDCITSVTVDPTPPPAKPLLYSAYGWRSAQPALRRRERAALRRFGTADSRQCRHDRLAGVSTRGHADVVGGE